MRAPPKPRDQFTTLLDELDELAATRDAVTVGAITSRLGAKGFGPFLLFLSLILILPIGMIPGVAGLIGILMIAVGAQMFRGRQGVWVPRKVRLRTIDADKVQSVILWTRRPLSWLGRLSRPRLRIFAVSKISILAMAVVLIIAGLSLLIVGVIPLVSPLYGLPMLFFAIALSAADGVAGLLGFGTLTAAFLLVSQLAQTI